MPQNDPQTSNTDNQTPAGAPRPGPDGPLPPKVIVRGDTIATPVSAASAEGEISEYEKAMRMVCDDMYVTLTKDRSKLPRALGRLHSAVALALNAPVDLEPADLPNNHLQVTPAGVEMLNATEQDPDALRELEVDTPALQAEVKSSQFLLSMITEASWLPNVLRNNWTHQVLAIDGRLRNAMRYKMERVRKNPRLLSKLPMTWELLTGSARKGVETRRENERLVDKTIKEERAKNPAPPAPLPDPNKKP